MQEEMRKARDRERDRVLPRPPTNGADATRDREKEEAARVREGWRGKVCVRPETIDSSTYREVQRLQSTRAKVLSRPIHLCVCTHTASVSTLAHTHHLGLHPTAALAVVSSSPISRHPR